MTSLHEYHQQHARDFLTIGGYSLPQRYRAHAEEYEAAMQAAMLDASFLGKLYVSGKDREALLHRLTTNEMRKLPVGKSRVNVFTNVKGRVIARVEMLAEEQRYLLLTGAGQGATLRAWIDKYTFIEEVKPIDATHALAVIALFGEESATRLQDCLGVTTHGMAAGSFISQLWQEHELIVHSPEAHSPAHFNLIISNTAALKLWQTLLPAFTPIGYAAFETLRILQGIPMAGHEITEEHNPHEIGLYPLVNFEKGCYLGQEVVARLDTYQKVQRQLMGIKLEIDPEVAAGATLFLEQQEIGKITSAAHARKGNGAIGLAIVRKQNAQPGTRVEARTSSGVVVHAALAALPFAD
ncbi:aminomethyl transferase family protein [candidate division KSB1 bacterium]|nr:aminomethyl transferase family protein [candidate division KSB1 bacterium]